MLEGVKTVQKIQNDNTRIVLFKPSLIPLELKDRSTIRPVKGRDHQVHVSSISGKTLIDSMILDPKTSVQHLFQLKEKEQSVIHPSRMTNINQVRLMPVGCLPAKLESWKKITHDERILQGIQFGFKVKVVNQDIQVRRNIIKNEEERIFVNQEIERLVLIGALVQVQVQPKICSALHLVPKGDSFRMVIDMSPLNEGLEIEKMKMETLSKILIWIKQGYFMISMDLESGYQHVPIFQEDWTKFGIKWEGKYYVFTVLPFGWKKSPLIFSRVVGKMIQHLRKDGMMIHAFLDDFLIVASSKEELLIRREKLQQELDQLGWKRAVHKGYWEPTQRLRFLGLEIDTVEGSVHIPKDKMNALYSLSAILIKKEKLPRRLLARVAGKFVSVALAFQPAQYVARMIYQSMDYNKQMCYPSFWWNQLVEVKQELKETLNWFKEEGKNWNGKHFVGDKIVAQIVLDTDASDNKYGAVFRDHTMKGLFSEEEKVLHIGEKELLTIWKAVFHWRMLLQGKRLQIRTDNRVALSYLLKAGGKIPRLNLLARKIWKVCMSFRIILIKPYWISSEENVIADSLSCGLEMSDWSIDPLLFLQIQKDLNFVCSIDRFANDHNTKCLRFNAATRSKGKNAEAIDCFTQDWKNENNYVLAPFALIGRVVNHIIQCQANTLIIVPKWEAQIWWHQLLKIQTEMLEIAYSPNNFCRNKFGWAEPLKNQNWIFYAVKILFQ
jgi:hypothetical protein